MKKPLSPALLRKMNAYWRAANYLSVGQIYLRDNPLLKQPLKLEHVKPRLLGHWGTTPGLNFIYVHLNRLIKETDANVIYLTGPGHGGPAILANVYLEGHSVKMVHNGIEYGLMAAYAEGLNILRRANVGKRTQAADAETTPLANPEYYQYDLDLADITEVWRRGSVIASWLLDLTATALATDAKLEHFAGRVSDSGEGRWTLDAAIDEAVPAPVLAAALFERFSSRGEAEFQDQLLSAMRFEFGGHVEKGGT
jgi:6-phosphogluconate dehydrogenase (decarboxylating)